MLKSSVKHVLIRSGALRLASRFAGKGVAIVMYHSVQDDPSVQSELLGGIIHSTKVFRGQMEVIARHFNPATLDDVLLFLRGEKELAARSVVVTFDDGYSDNYEIARPVLDQCGVPGAFYVAVDSIDRQTLPWPAHLRQLFLTTKVSLWNEPGGNTWQLNGREQRLRAFEQASKHCAKLAGDKQKSFLESASRELQAKAPRVSGRPMMSWDELRALVEGGHIVGSHTMTHPNMAQVPSADAQIEFTESKHRLEEEIRKPIVHFSYPCPALQPHWVENTVDLSRKAGYATGVTTDGGMVRQPDNALKLRRIRPTKTVQGFHWNLERTFSGAIV
jgi:peptidoglycan/xylan/chitin deacetylase (PgdA/CDA1 family)